MRALTLRIGADGRRERVLVDGWPEPPPPGESEFATRTLRTGLSNGTERNLLLGGSYTRDLPAGWPRFGDSDLPSAWAYLNAGEVVEAGAAAGVEPGALVFTAAGHVERAVTAAGGLWCHLGEVGPTEGALLGLAAIARRGCERLHPVPGERVLVVGAGCIGLLCVQLLRLAGAVPTLVDVDGGRLDIARAIDPGIATEWRRPGEPAAGPGAAFDAAVDTAGAPLDGVLAALRPRARLLLVAGRDRVEYSHNLAQDREVTLLHTTHFDASDLRVVAALAGGGGLRLGPLVRDLVPVERAGAVYRTLRDDPGRLLGTVFDWERV